MTTPMTPEQFAEIKARNTWCSQHDPDNWMPVHQDRAALIAEVERLQQLHGRYCGWTANGDGLWDTGCGHVFEFIAEGPDENSFAHCPFCGQKINASNCSDDDE